MIKKQIKKTVAKQIQKLLPFIVESAKKHVMEQIKNSPCLCQKTAATQPTENIVPAAVKHLGITCKSC